MTPADIIATIEDCLSESHFAVRVPLRLHWIPPKNETIFWELFHGRALDSTMTRHQMTFSSWNVVLDQKANEPLISVKWNRECNVLFVTRAVLCHAHETMETSTNVIETRETTRWMRELVGRVDLNELPANRLSDELHALVAQAVYGTGRLPLTSLETPLPQFLLGQLGYFPKQFVQSFRQLELVLRSPEFDPESTANNRDGKTTLADLRNIILNISLSPYTGIIGNMLNLLRCLQQAERISIDERVDFLGWLIRLQWRHLNAYDLKTFHHRGANYPDALLIDEVFRELLAVADKHGKLLDTRGAKRGRRAIRLGWFLRLIYRGQPAPEHPTSPGENLRVMPMGRVPDEQIFQPQARPRRLFDKPLDMSPNAERLLAVSFRDMNDVEELIELGTALVLDRPLGIGKIIGEPDATPLLAHVVYSRKLALKNLALLRDAADERLMPFLNRSLEQVIIQWQPSGPKIMPLHRQLRPGVVSLEDVFQTADDFHVLQSTKNSVVEFVDQLNLPSDLTTDLAKWFIVLPVATPDGEVLRVFDKQGNNWLTLQADYSQGYLSQRGVEWPINIRVFRC